MVFFVIPGFAVSAMHHRHHACPAWGHRSPVVSLDNVGSYGAGNGLVHIFGEILHETRRRSGWFDMGSVVDNFHAGRALSFYVIDCISALAGSVVSKGVRGRLRGFSAILWGRVGLQPCRLYRVGNSWGSTPSPGRKKSPAVHVESTGQPPRLGCSPTGTLSRPRDSP